MGTDAIPDDLRRDPEVERCFTIGARRAEHIHRLLTRMPPMGLTWLDGAAAVFLLLLGWWWRSFLITILAFCAYLALHRIIVILLTTFALVVRVHRQLIYLVQKRPDLDRTTLGYMDYVLGEFARYNTFSEKDGMMQCRHAFTEMLGSRLREEGLSGDEIGDELGRYTVTIDPNQGPRRGNLNLKGPECYTDRDFRY